MRESMREYRRYNTIDYNLYNKFFFIFTFMKNNNEYV